MGNNPINIAQDIQRHTNVWVGGRRKALQNENYREI